MKSSEFTEEVSISDLISGCIHGNKLFWNIFFKKFHKMISGYAILRARDSVEDTTQRIYLRLVEDDYNVLKKFNGDSYGGFLLFLRGVCRNVIMDENKRYTRDLEREFSLDFGDSEFVDPRSELKPDTGEDKERLLGLIFELKSGYRDVMLLKIDGFKAREIAEILNIPQNTVLTRIRRSLEKMRISVEAE